VPVEFLSAHVMIPAMMVAMQARTKTTNKPSRPWVFLPLAIAFAIIAGIAIYGVLSPSKAKPAPAAPGYRGSLVWGDGIFSNRAQLKAWLLLHGASYKDWVKLHPAAIRLVKPPVKHKAVAAHKPRKAAKPKVAHTSPAPTAAPASKSTESSSHSLVILLAVIAGLLLGGLAALPRRMVRRVSFLAAFDERELRLGALAAGAACLLGVIVATLISV
jgi:hypothetical protein